MSRPAVTLARALSKLGYCSRSEARRLIAAGKVRVNGGEQRNADCWVDLERDAIRVEGRPAAPEAKVYLMLNKPRGLVTTTSDEQGRETVYRCFENRNLPWVAPVGRLDRASEGLLLFTNDTRWADQILSPQRHLDKTYHVQINCLANDALLERLRAGTSVENEFLAAKRVKLLRQGTRNSWIEVVLDEGKNRQIRRLLAAFGIDVLRLVRVAIGPLQLGSLAKGAFRHLTERERESLARAARRVSSAV